ncbi:hypothetical protein JHK82_036440 [Glycine max]|nr:hypothetical protein JHK82_036440 [Glycine max]
MMSRSDKGKPFSQKCRRRCGFTKLKGQQEELYIIINDKKERRGNLLCKHCLFFSPFD